MAGYIFNLDSEDSLRLYVDKGVYSTKLSDPKNIWGKHHEGVFADFSSMKNGDNVYFFIKRKIYGVGILINIDNIDCIFLNYPGALTPKIRRYKDVKSSLLLDEGRKSACQRVVCCFKPDPNFFHRGIDMDDVLASSPSSFRSLRSFWKLSFIKLDDEENQALKSSILTKNETCILEDDDKQVYDDNHEVMHLEIAGKLNESYKFSVSEILKSCAVGDSIKHEMAIEVALIYQLTTHDNAAERIFGSWDYLSHQVVASPFKPIDYMDKMDIFGYRFLGDHKPTKSRYLVGEIKKGKAANDAIDQIMKYVDWVKNEYCRNDYSKIEAYLVAYDFESNAREYLNEYARRQYTVGSRPAISSEWSKCKLVRYRFNEETNKLEFIEI